MACLRQISDKSAKWSLAFSVELWNVRTATVWTYEEHQITKTKTVVGQAPHCYKTHFCTVTDNVNTCACNMMTLTATDANITAKRLSKFAHCTEDMLRMTTVTVHKAARYAPPLYAARCSPAPDHTRLTPAAPSASCTMNIHHWQAAACSGYDYSIVHIKYVLLNSQPIVWWPWPFDLESGVRVTCDVGYLCANFSLPRPLCSRVMPDVPDRRQTDRRQTKASLNASAH